MRFFGSPRLAATLGALAIGGPGCAPASPPGESAPGPIPAASAEVDGAPPVTGFFSDDQAERGQGAFDDFCSECHGISEFRGVDFEWQWRRQTAWNLYVQIAENMPEDAPGTLTSATYSDVVAFILRANDYQGGGPELTATETLLRTIPLGPGAVKTRANQ